jgi:hypothetical protein
LREKTLTVGAGSSSPSSETSAQSCSLEGSDKEAGGVETIAEGFLASTPL